MPKVYIKFPKTGLGNMMLVWARGIVFAKINNIPVVTSSWWGLRWGALIRREQRKRLYWGYFKESSFFKRIITKAKSNRRKVKYEPVIQKMDADELCQNDLYVFNKVITNDDLFFGIRDNKSIVEEELYNILTPKMKVQLQQFIVPEIGIHIRRGDFKLGNPITPLSFFIKGINLIRTNTGKNLSVTIFTDADKSELEEILQLSNVSLAEKKPDILDILLLSKSKIIFLSRSSSFSYWAAFLSEAMVIRPVNDWQEIIKKNNSNYQEVKWEETDESLTKEFVTRIKGLTVHSNY